MSFADSASDCVVPGEVPAVTLRDYQEKAKAAVLAARDRGLHRVMVVMPTGTGKCLGRGTPVLMFDGTIRPVETIKPGELLMGPDSNPRRVLSTCSGSEELYRVTPKKGDPYVVNESHVLSLRMTKGATKGSGIRGSRYQAGTIWNLSVSEWFKASRTFRHCAKGYRTGVDFESKTALLDPYFLGLWLGDGTSAGPEITTIEPEIIGYIEQLACEFGLEVRVGRHPDRVWDYLISSGLGASKNPIKEALRSYGLLNNKHIPQDYLANDRKVRLAVLAGLIDTDGHLTCGGYDLVFKSAALASGAAFLARSLGLAAYVKPCEKTCTQTNASGTYFRVSISGDTSAIPVRVPRKKAPKRKQKKDVLSVGIDIEPLGKGEYFGFEIDGDGLFLLGDFTVTHNTTLFAALVDEFDRNYAEGSLVVAHRSELLHQAANRIRLIAPRLKVGIEGGPLTAEEGARAVVAGVQTIGRPDSKRLSWFHPGLLIMDEGHHAPADTWQNVLRRFGAYEGTCFTLAVTATDHRMDNKPLHGTESAIFEDVVFRYPLRQAVADGWLVDLRGYRVATGTDLTKVRKVRGDYHQAELARAVNTEERNYEAFRHWSDIARDRRTIVFCVDVQHAKDVAELYRSHHIAAEHVDGTMKADVREGVMRRFGNGHTQVLVNVDVATEGFDVPAVSCVLMLRPTQSWGLYAQMAGRGVRTLPGVVEGKEHVPLRRRSIQDSDKPDCIVIDVVDLAGKFQLQAPEEREDAKGAPAGVAGLVGLPPDFDLQGHSVFEAATMADDLGPLKRAQLFRRPMSFDEIDTVLTEVDLLRELSIPEEIIGHSALAWLKVGEGEYALPCGSSGFERDRLAKISMDLLGRFTLTLSSSLMEYPPLPLGDDLSKIFDEADRLIRMTWSDCAHIVRADASWREQKPTERQVDTLRRMGVPDDVIVLCDTAGQARALIEQHKLGNGRKRRRGERRDA